MPDPEKPGEPEGEKKKIAPEVVILFYIFLCCVVVPIACVVITVFAICWNGFWFCVIGGALGLTFGIEAAVN